MKATPLPITYYTATGERVAFERPFDTTIRADDLYLHSSRICRNGGARVWSLLNHSLLVAVLAELAGCDDEVKAYSGAHDLHECYIGDLVTALKALLPSWKPTIERPWETRVHLALALTFPPEPRVAEIVKLLDHRAFAIEVVLLGHPMIADVTARLAIDESPITQDECAAFLRIQASLPGQNWRRLVGFVPGLARLP